MTDDHAYTLWIARLEGYQAREKAKLALLQRQLADLKQAPTQPRRRGHCYAWAG